MKYVIAGIALALAVMLIAGGLLLRTCEGDDQDNDAPEQENQEEVVNVPAVPEDDEPATEPSVQRPTRATLDLTNCPDLAIYRQPDGTYILRGQDCSGLETE